MKLDYTALSVIWLFVGSIFYFYTLYVRRVGAFTYFEGDHIKKRIKSHAYKFHFLSLTLRLTKVGVKRVSRPWVM